MKNHLPLVLMAIGFAIVLALGTFQIVDIPMQFSPYKIVPEFPLFIWLALTFVVVGLLLILTRRKRQSDAFIVLAIILTIIVFYGSLPVSETNLTYYDSWLHSSTAKTIVTHGHFRFEYGAYHSWPSFFLWFAALNIVTGIDFPLLGKFLPSILNCLAFVWIFLLYRRLGLKNRAALVAIVAFILANDRVYANTCPSNFVFALYGSVIYLMFLELESGAKRRYFVTFFLLFATIVSAHPLIPSYVLFPAIMFIAMALLFRQKVICNSVSNKFYAGATLWCFWSLFMIAPFWWENIALSLRTFISRATTLENPVNRALSYWKYGNPPPGIQGAQLFIIGIALALSLFGFAGYIRELYSRIKTKNITGNLWLPPFTLFSLVFGCMLASALPFFLLGGSILTDKVLLFIWIPASFFIGYLFTKFKRNQRKVCSIVLIMLLIPAFAVFHWNEFWLSVHDWEINSFSFMSKNIPSATIVTDSGSTAILQYFCPNSSFVTDGLPEKPGLALPAFLGNVSPTSIKSRYEPTLIKWEYFLRSAKQMVRLNLYFGVHKETLHQLDASLTNSCSINRVYDNEFVQIYYRND